MLTFSDAMENADPTAPGAEKEQMDFKTVIPKKQNENRPTYH